MLQKFISVQPILSIDLWSKHIDLKSFCEDKFQERLLLFDAIFE